MTNDQALKIKEWRLDGYSWRMLAELSCIQWGVNSPKTIHFNKITKNTFGNQIYGRDLHNLAEKVLNEKFD